MEKLKMHSPDLTAHNIARIAELFPTVVSETVDEEGAVSRAIDFDLLRQELSDHIVEGPQERYQLDWPGKREALFTANAPIAKTLRPVPEESVDFETTGNLFIEGDNLEALKLLQESYLGKVKLIYIDPPYNTGNDFVYNDDFAESNAEYMAKSGQVDDEGIRLVANTESNGRFHSDWLSMMYPRLKLARNLLADDGVIFVSIDDHERDNAKRVLDEIFGEPSFISAVVWRRKASPDARSTIGSVHDYILCYVRNAANPKQAVGKMALSKKRLASFTNPDGDSRGPWASVDMTGMTGRATKDQYFAITLPSGRKIKPPDGRSWGLVARTFEELRADGRIWFGQGGDNVPRIKRFLSETDGQTVPSYWDSDEVGTNEEASDEILALFDGVKVFDTPKPTRLMRRLLEIGTTAGRDSLVLDFFCGSATMADAVLRQNAADGGNRAFIMVQLPETSDPQSAAEGAGYSTLAEVSRERIRRAGTKVLDGVAHENWNKDVGFRVLKTDTTNMTDVLRTPDQLEQGELTLYTDSVKADRTDEDLLFQLLLDWGLALTLPIEVEEIAEQQVLVVEVDALVACFADEVSVKMVTAIAERQPLRAVFRDSAFVTPADRINAEQIFAERSPATDVKTV